MTREEHIIEAIGEILNAIHLVLELVEEGYPATKEVASKGLERAAAHITRCRLAIDEEKENEWPT